MKFLKKYINKQVQHKVQQILEQLKVQQKQVLQQQKQLWLKKVLHLVEAIQNIKFICFQLSFFKSILLQSTANRNMSYVVESMESIETLEKFLNQFQRKHIKK